MNSRVNDTSKLLQPVSAEEMEAVALVPACSLTAKPRQMRAEPRLAPSLASTIMIGSEMQKTLPIKQRVARKGNEKKKEKRKKSHQGQQRYLTQNPLSHVVKEAMKHGNKPSTTPIRLH